MSGRDLKNYEKYLDKLLKYALGVELKVVFKEEFNEGMYLPSKRMIRVDTDLEQSTEISVLLHELGHAMDDALTEISLQSDVGKAYKAFYKAKPTKKQVTIVVQCEENAWSYGRVIAKNLRIPLGRWYDEEATAAIEEYKTHHNEK